MSLFTEAAMALRYGAPIDRVIVAAFLGEAEETDDTEEPAATTARTPKSTKARKTPIENRALKAEVDKARRKANSALVDIEAKARASAKQYEPGEIYVVPLKGGGTRAEMGIDILRRRERTARAAEAVLKERKVSSSSASDQWIRKHGNVSFWDKYGDIGGVIGRNKALALGGLGAAGLLGAYLLTKARSGAAAHQPPPPPHYVADQFAHTHNPMPYPNMPHRGHPWVE